VSIWPAETPGGQQISICLVGMSRVGRVSRCGCVAR
jgi:hypothetical protein